MFKRITSDGTTDDLTPKQYRQLIDQYQDQNDCLMSYARVLFYLMKDFSLELTELDSDDFKSRIDELVNAFDKADSPRAVQHTFEKGKQTIIGFAAREKQYLKDRETEFKGIIEFLRKTLYSVVGESQTFNSQMYQQNLRMEDLLHINDIRQIKQSLQTEVGQMQATIQAKQANDTKRIEMLSREVAILRTNLQWYKDAATTDALTQACNRLAFDTHIRSCVEQAEIHRRPLSVLMCDIDNFKSFNTQLGHQMGDVVLQVFVAKCKGIVRETDMVARYGGDEFAIILPETNLRQAMKIAQRICREVSGTKYVHESATSNTEFSFTASIGVATAHRRDKVHALIERADKALYVAKYAGKSCVCTEQDAPQTDHRMAA